MTILCLALAIVTGLVYLRHPERIGPFRQLQRVATFARACVICAGWVARVIPRNWLLFWPDAVRDAKEGK